MSLPRWPVTCALQAESLSERVRVTRVAREETSELITSAGSVTADNVVLATGIPFLDRGLYFAKVTAQRSYALAFRGAAQIPRGMYISADSPTRSLRTALHDGEELLLIGGNGHPVGRHSMNPSELITDLTDWTRRWFEGAERTHVWSAQDYEAHGGVPFVGKLPRGGGHVYLATGYSKWGMTNSVTAALRISGEILHNVPAWARTSGDSSEQAGERHPVLPSKRRHRRRGGPGMVGCRASPAERRGTHASRRRRSRQSRTG